MWYSTDLILRCLVKVSADWRFALSPRTLVWKYGPCSERTNVHHVRVISLPALEHLFVCFFGSWKKSSWPDFLSSAEAANGIPKMKKELSNKWRARKTLGRENTMARVGLRREAWPHPLALFPFQHSPRAFFRPRGTKRPVGRRGPSPYNWMRWTVILGPFIRGKIRRVLHKTRPK